MIRKIILFVLVIMLCVQAGVAMKLVSIGLDVSKNDSVLIQDIRVTLGSPDDVYRFPGEYSVERVENGEIKYKTFVPLIFKVTAHPIGPKPVNSLFVDAKIPYIDNRGELLVKHNDSVIYRFDLGLLCDNNKKCGAFENYLSCPSDCELEKNDDLCVLENDGVCDPDCAPGKDNDCAAVDEMNMQALGLVLAIIIIGIILPVWYVVRRVRP